jgi:MFS family permease
MERKIRWFDHLTINSYWLGINIASSILTPILTPYLVLMFMPEGQKNTYLATVRVIGLAVAMLIQPLAGMLSDRNTSRFGRRRPFMAIGTAGNVLFLAIIGISPLFIGSPADRFFMRTAGITTAYALLLIGTILLQFSSNIAHGALQGLIPDLVPESQRGRASGVKAVLELLPVFLAIFIGPLVDKGLVGLVVGIIAAGFVLTLLVTLIYVREKPISERPAGEMLEPALRLVALTAIFVGVTRLALWLVNVSGTLLDPGAPTSARVLTIGLAGLAAMAGSILVGVYFGAWVGIGKQARKQTSFIWWVINRLLFLAAVGSIQGVALYFLRDTLKIENAASMTTYLMASVAVFLLPSALVGGNLADRIGRRRLVLFASIVAAGGTLLLLFSRNMPMVILSGCIIGVGAGTFMATSWALGTDLAPAEEAGRYLGISNLAGAGAGIVGAGIGGPIADSFNAIQDGLGYLVIFAIYGGLFVFAALTLLKVKAPTPRRSSQTAHSI